MSRAAVAAPPRRRPRARAKSPTRQPKQRTAPRRTTRRAPATHPRIRARRVSVARDAGRRRLRRLLTVLGTVAVVAAGAGAVWSPLLDVDRVAVTGAGGRAAEVRAAAAVEYGVPLLLFDTGAAAERVDALDWVADVDVSRRLPGTVQIDVRMRPPVAFARNADGTAALVDATGTVLSTAAAPPDGMTELATDAPPPGVGERVRPVVSARVAGRLGPLDGRVARVSVDRGQAALLLTDGTEVRLGDLGRLHEKATAADAVLAALAGSPVVYVDVRVPSAPVTG